MTDNDDDDDELTGEWAHEVYIPQLQLDLQEAQYFEPPDISFDDVLEPEPWTCKYRAPACVDGYHGATCDNSCDRFRTAQLRREGKI
jgi:hypothetical protein